MLPLWLVALYLPSPSLSSPVRAIASPAISVPVIPVQAHRSFSSIPSFGLWLSLLTEGFRGSFPRRASFLGGLQVAGLTSSRYRHFTAAAAEQQLSPKFVTFLRGIAFLTSRKNKPANTDVSGAQVLAQSLCDGGATKKLAVIVTLIIVSESTVPH